MFTDLFVANAGDASRIAARQDSPWPRLEAKGVDQVKLASLALLLQGQKPNEELVIKYIRNFENLIETEEGPWIDRIPEHLVSLLAELAESRISTLAARWADTEEARMDRWSTEDAANGIRELMQLCSKATELQKSVLLRISL